MLQLRRVQFPHCFYNEITHLYTYQWNPCSLLRAFTIPRRRNRDVSLFSSSATCAAYGRTEVDIEEYTLYFREKKENSMGYFGCGRTQVWIIGIRPLAAARCGALSVFTGVCMLSRDSLSASFTALHSLGARVRNSGFRLPIEPRSMCMYGEKEFAVQCRRTRTAFVLPTRRTKLAQYWFV